MIKLDWKSIPTAVEDPEVVEEFEKLESWAHSLSYTFGDDKVAIEIGSYCGRSTVLLAQYFKMLAIDLWGTGMDLGASSKVIGYNMIGEGPTFTEFIRNMKKFKLIDWLHYSESLGRVHPICSTSVILDILPPLDAKMAFVDAEHAYPSALIDLQRCARHLSVGGYAVVHDYRRPGWGYPPFDRSEVDPWYGNALSVDDFLRTNSNFEIVEHFHGIVAMIKRG